MVMRAMRGMSGGTGVREGQRSERSLNAWCVSDRAVSASRLRDVGPSTKIDVYTRTGPGPRASGPAMRHES